MKDKKQITLSEHMTNAVIARWANYSPEERSAYAKKMVVAREAKREAAKQEHIRVACAAGEDCKYPKLPHFKVENERGTDY